LEAIYWSLNIVEQAFGLGALHTEIVLEQADNLLEVFGAAEAAEAAEAVGLAGPAGVEGLLVVAGRVSEAVHQE
jgi:hypothetical protein